jgi:hypothetical protein
MDIVLLLLMGVCLVLATAAVTYSVMLYRSLPGPVEPAVASTAPPEPTDEDADSDDFDEPEIPKDAIEIDPAHPPKTMVYNPKGDRPRPLCFCHARYLVPSTEYLWWPMTDGSVRIYCKDRT